MADPVEIMLELERRGALPPDKAPIIAELRKRGAIPGGQLEPQSQFNSFNTPTIEDTAGQPTPPPSQGPMTGALPVERNWSDVPLEAAKNLPSSALNFGKAIVQPIIHPIDTAKAVGTVVSGGLGKGAEALGMTPTSPENVAAFDSVVNMFKERYKDEESLKKTIATDPVSFMADLSTVLTGGGAAASKLGLVKTGAAVSKVGRAVNPINMAGKVVKPIANLAGETLAGALGMTTGTGPESVKAAYRGGKEFTDAMRGKTPEGDIVQITKDALDDIKEARRVAYQDKIASIGKSTATLDITPVQNKLNNLMKQFNIKPGAEPGQWDFSRSKLDRSTWGPVGDLINDVKGWGSKAEDLTPVGMDTLKQRIDDFYSATKNSRALVTPLRDSVKEVLVKSVPGYHGMTFDYAKASSEIGEIEKALSLGPKAGADTILRKLNTMMRENQDFRRSLADKLSVASGDDIKGMVAGAGMRPVIPGNRLLPALTASGIGQAAYSIGDPKVLLLLSLASPRLVGEFTNLIGQGARAVKPVVEKLPTNVMYQAGRIKEETDQEKAKREAK